MPSGGMPEGKFFIFGELVKGCRPLTDPEVIAVQSELGRNPAAIRDTALFITGIRTGFRISELLSLKVGAVFQNGNYVDFLTVEKQHMKGEKSSRSVPLHPEARSALERLLKELGTKGLGTAEIYLFQSRKGLNRPLGRRAAWTMLHEAFARCGLTGKLGSHVMRKTFARRMYEYFDHDLILLQEAMGHARITSTTSYLSFSRKRVYDAFLKS